MTWSQCKSSVFYGDPTSWSTGVAEKGCRTLDSKEDKCTWFPYSLSQKALKMYRGCDGGPLLKLGNWRRNNLTSIINLFVSIAFCPHASFFQRSCAAFSLLDSDGRYGRTEYHVREKRCFRHSKTVSIWYFFHRFRFSEDIKDCPNDQLGFHSILWWHIFTDKESDP